MLVAGTLGHEFLLSFSLSVDDVYKWGLDKDVPVSAQALTGYSGCPAVVAGNAVAELLGTLIIPLIIWLGLFWVLENPTSSLLFKWESIIRQFLQQADCLSVCIDLGIYGCICSKRLSFQGTWPGLKTLKAIDVALRGVLPKQPQNLPKTKATKVSGRCVMK